MTFPITQHNQSNVGLEKKIGEFLEMELEKIGLEVMLPTDADWGYVFRAKYADHLFDIIVKLPSQTEVTISVDSASQLFGELFHKKSTTERSELEGIIESLCKNMGFS